MYMASSKVANRLLQGLELGHMSLHQTYLTLNVFEIVSLNCIHATYYLPGEKKAAMPAKPIEISSSTLLILQIQSCLVWTFS